MWFLLLIFIATLARDSHSQTGGGIILARVVDAQTQQPIPSAVVSLTGPIGGRTVKQLTDGLGRSVFIGLVNGTYRIRVTASGYLEHGVFTTDAPAPAGVVIGPGHALLDIPLPVFRSAVIRGTVSDEAGQPLADVVVRAAKVAEPRDGFLIPAALEQVRTNDLGKFSLDGLRPGAYLISTDSTPVGALRGRQMVRAGTAFPSGWHDGPQPVVVGFGDQRSSVGLIAPLVPATRLSGRLYSTSVRVGGVPLRLVNATDTTAARIDLESAAGVATVRTDPTGNFVFENLAAGPYLLLGSQVDVPDPTGDTKVWWIRALVDVPEAGVENLGIELQRGLTFTGRLVRDPSDKAAGLPSVEPLRVAADPVATGAQAVWGATRSTVAKQDGQFILDGLVPGRYRLRVAGARGLVVGSITDGRHHRAVGPIDLDQDLDGLELWLTDRLGRLEGSVDIAEQGANAGAEGAMIVDVILFPVNQVAWSSATQDSLRFRRIQTGADGAFVIAEVPFGEYAVVAVPRTTSVLDWTNRAFLQQLAGAAARVSITDRATRSVHLSRPRSTR